MVKKIEPLLKYCVIGALVTLIDLFTVYLLKDSFDVTLMWAVVWGFFLANSTSFVFNKYWTFSNYSVTIVRQYTKFLIVSLVGLGITVFLMWLLAEQLQLFKDLTPKYYLICKLIASGIVVLWNFLCNKLWTFTTGIRLYPEFRFSADYPLFLSVVIPAFNEQTRIVSTIKKVFTYLDRFDFYGEIVVVDDGSNDRTSQVCKRLFGDRSNFRVLRHTQNRGKGFSVKTGIENAVGEYILVVDADNSTPIEEFDKFSPLLSPKRIIVGSRYLQPHLVELPQPWYRILISRIANMLIKLFVVENVQDTQCGFKVYHNEIGRYFAKLQRINRFAFDIEYLSLAQLSGIEILEMPVRWINSSASRIRPIRDTLRTFYDLIKIKSYIWRRTYSSTGHQENQYIDVQLEVTSDSTPHLFESSLSS